jgi:hypothetical protein
MEFNLGMNCKRDASKKKVLKKNGMKRLDSKSTN